MFRKKTAFDDPGEDRGIVLRDREDLLPDYPDIPGVHWSPQELMRPAWTCNMLDLAAQIVTDP